MKKNMPWFVLALSGLVIGLAGCSKSGSPTAPKASPTPQAVNLSLTVSESEAVVGLAVEARATVTQGSSPVADGTPVSFFTSSANCTFIESSINTVTKQTTAGVASVAFTCNTAGEIKISAAVGSANASRTVRFFAAEQPTEGPRFYAISPSRGSARGGYNATITGQRLCKAYSNNNCLTPGDYTMKQSFVVGTDVIIDPNGNVTVVTKTVDREVALQVVSASGNQIEDTVVVTIPEADPDFLLEPAKVTLTLNNGVGTVDAVAVFEYLPDFIKVGLPQIFAVTPAMGAARGGEEVLITGQSLCVLAIFDTGQCDTQYPPSVRFDPPGADAEVTWVSPDGRALRVKTPFAGAQPLAQDLLSAVSVANATGSATRPDAFVYVAETPAPQLYALMPNAGPIEGGTRVTIFGSGFQAPVEVRFGDRQAQVISSNYTEIVCITPSIAPSAPFTPTVVNVTVTNILTGMQSANALQYRYGEAMFVSGISPVEGYIRTWTPATIYGQGFVAPVQVLVTAGDFTKEARVLSVSGTAIQVQMPPFEELAGEECIPVGASFQVTNLGSNLTASGTGFTYLCSSLSGP